MNQDLLLLKERLSQRAAALLLGAGFSFGAKNQGGNELPLGKGLAKKLYDHFYVECPPDKDTEYIESVAAHQEDLRKICSILRSENRQSIRDIYLSKVFSGCHPCGSQYQSKIRSYKWDTIFTLNIDDLVENIFNTANTPLCVWNYSNNGQRTPNVQTLIKLHGDINSLEDGFVFDDDEYSAFSSDNNCLLKEFAHIFLTKDMVILGSQFQESDIAVILNIYETAGYKSSDCHYFFVVPKINDIILRNKIDTIDNFHWIEMDTEMFLNFVSQQIVQVENTRNLLKERGAIFIDEVTVQENYISQIYNGRPTQYNDFFGQWDIVYPKQKNLIKKIVAHHMPVTIITLFGNPYNGKTTVAKRCLIDLKEKGYLAIEIPRMGYDLYESLPLYLSTLSAKSQVALLIENAAYQYEHIVAFVEKHLDVVDHLVIITTDTEQNHIGRNHHLFNLPGQIEWYNFEVSEKITSEFAAKIFYTLCVKRRLNNYLKYCAPKTHPTDRNNMFRIWDEMKKANDIIDVLYFSSEGKYFRDYYAEWVICHQNEYYDDYLYVLSGLGKLGISEIPLYMLPKLIPQKASRFHAEEFLACYPDIVEVKNGHIKLLRSRLISSVLRPRPDDTFKTAIYQLVRYTMGLFTEGDDSQAYELFQKALRVKRLRNYSLLSHDQMKELFTSLEKHCSSISYFWVQYGLVFQLIGSFEDANNHFLYAKSIRPNSYQVEHALAKNRMEIGLDDLKKGKPSADENFQQGCRDMEKIIFNPDYSRALSYSVHSYATMLMKYYKQKNEIIPDDQCKTLNSLFKALLEKQIDSNIKEIIIKFFHYCKGNNIEQYCAGLNKVWTIVPYVIIDEDDI